MIFLVFLYINENTKEAIKAKTTFKIPEYKCARENKIATRKIVVISINFC